MTWQCVIPISLIYLSYHTKPEKRGNEYNYRQYIYIRRILQGKIFNRVIGN